MNINDEWYTPSEIIHSLGTFDLDPATSLEAYKLNHSANNIYTKKENGLIQDWKGRIWLNPPYSQPLLRLFLEKMAIHDNGIALVFSKVEAQWFHDVVFSSAISIKFLYHRIKFHRTDGSVGLQPRNGSMLVAYGPENTKILSRNKLKGKFLYL